MCVCGGGGGGGRCVEKGEYDSKTTSQLLLWPTTVFLTTDSWDTLLPHPLREGPTGLPVTVLFCAVPDNESSSMDRETKLVLLAGREDRLQSFAGGEVGVVM